MFSISTNMTDLKVLFDVLEISLLKTSTHSSQKTTNYLHISKMLSKKRHKLNIFRKTALICRCI